MQEVDVNIDLSEVQMVPQVGTDEVPRILLREIENEPGNFLLILDNTADEKIVRCPTAGRWYLVEGREAHAKNAALVFGGALHDGLELYYKGASDQEQNNAIVKYFTENSSPPDEYRTVQNALEVMSNYRQQHMIRDDYQLKILEDDAGLIIERPFELPLGVLEVNDKIKLPQWDEAKQVNEVHVAWAGRIDLAAEMNYMNRVTDHKTTSMGGDQFIQGFQLSNQTIGYDWAAQQMWPNLFPRGKDAGFCLNAIYLKKPAGNTPLMNRGPRGGEPALQFFRSYFQYPQTVIDQWAENALVKVEDFVHSLVRGFFPTYTAHCFNKFGKCPYFEVCSLPQPESRLRFLHSDAFKNVTWDPTVGR